MNKEGLIREVTRNVYQTDQWRDPYDTEVINNRIIRGLSKRFILIFPNVMYNMKILSTKEWDENYIMLGIASLNLGMDNEVKYIVRHLTSKKSWGLPIIWNSGKYKFPKESLMSTTTSEAILFLSEAYHAYPNLINVSYFSEVGYKLLETLRKNYIDKNKRILFSYTKFDTYKVLNSNFLVAAALKTLYEITNEETFYIEYKSILESLDMYLPKKGYVPYFLQGDEATADAYHQLFSMRAARYLKYESNMEKYFEDNFIDSNGVLLKPKKKLYDLQGFSESLRYYGLAGNKDMYLTIYNKKPLLVKRNKFIQRAYKIKGVKLKSNAVFARQGYLRLLLGLSYGFKNEYI